MKLDVESASQGIQRKIESFTTNNFFLHLIYVNYQSKRSIKCKTKGNIGLKRDISFKNL